MSRGQRPPNYSRELSVMFEITPIDPEHYRQQTRRSTLLIALIFLMLAMLCATASTQLLGTPGGAGGSRTGA